MSNIFASYKVVVSAFHERILGLGREGGRFDWHLYREDKKEISSMGMGLIGGWRSALVGRGPVNGA